MINWEELKHIHVIRKLEEILGQWFSTDILFVDERGQIRNYDALDRTREFKNPLTAMFFSREHGRQLISRGVTEANEKSFQTKEPHIIVHGPAGVESVVVSRIQVDNDFLGSVYAYGYADKVVSEEKIRAGRQAMEALGFDGAVFEKAVGGLRVLNEGEKKYFYELVDLVAQEIVTSIRRSASARNGSTL